MTLDHSLPIRSRSCEPRNAKSPDDCKAGFGLPGIGLGIAAAAMTFSGGQAASLGEWRLGIGELIVAGILVLWAGLH